MTIRVNPRNGHYRSGSTQYWRAYANQIARDGSLAGAIGSLEWLLARPVSIVAIVCAFNEAPRIGNVLKILTSCPVFRKVIVVDDGSSDGTDQIVSQFPNAQLIRLRANRGKGYAMQRAVRASFADVFFFCDADVQGLTHRVIVDVLTPVVAGLKDMMIAQRANAFYAIPFVLSVTPKLGGIRAVTRNLWNLVPRRFKRRFKIEAALNHMSQTEGAGFAYTVVDGLSQVLKEQKEPGWVRGFIARVKMCGDVIFAYLELNFLTK